MFLTALSLGFLHGLGVDHLMAIAALAVNGDRQRANGRIVRTAVGFAVGHTVVLALGAAAAILLGIVLPSALESGAERLGGLLLIVLGGFGLWSVASGRTFGHVHSERDGRVRWHLHFSRAAAHPHAHSRIPTAMGAVFAFSSLRALTLLEPFGVTAVSLALPSLFLLVLLFGFGILLSMSLFGVVLARVLSLAALRALGQAAAALVAIASIALGVYWIVIN
jgi:hypothetical protein